MPLVSLSGVAVTEPDRSSTNAEFRFTLDAPATTATRLYYYTLDGSASSRNGDYYERATSIDVPAGETEGTIDIPVYADDLVEGDETFNLVLLASPGVTLQDGAAAVMATATILDPDDTVTSGTPGPGAAAVPIQGPPSAAPDVRTIRVQNVATIEGDRSSDNQQFLITLDAPATTPIRVYYYTQDVTATGNDDYYERSGYVTIDPGFQSQYVSISAYGDTAAEGDEQYQVVFTTPTNAVFESGAAAMVATGTIIDDDAGAPSMAGGLKELATLIDGPDGTDDKLPTLRVQSPSIIERDSSSRQVEFLYTLDRPATAEITGSYATLDGTAAAAQGDYYPTSSTFTIPVGATSGKFTVSVYGDQTAEPDETFSLLLTSLDNARFEDDAAALRAEATILDDDGGAVSGEAGIGQAGKPFFGPDAADALLPTLQIHNASAIEGNGSSSYTMRFLVTLDRPALSDVEARYTVMDGPATAGLDFYGTTGTLTIAEGERSGYINVSVYRDSEIEGDESFYLSLTDLKNAVFLEDAPATAAMGTIIDDDGGAPSGPGGVGIPAFGVRGPAATPDGNTVVRLVGTSLAETDGPNNTAYVHILLSNPAPEPVTLEYETRAVTATQGTDYYGASDTITIPTGVSSTRIGFTVYSDDLIEGDEAFDVVFTSLSGASLEGGPANNSVRVTIRDDDGTGTAGNPATGPQFAYINPYAGDDIQRGGGTDDTLTGFTGNDVLIGNGGEDTLLGGAGHDRLFGDALYPGYAADVSAQVYRLYQATLDREPDGAGHGDWTAQIYTGEVALSTVAARFANSREFQNTYGDLDDNAFIEQLYLNVLGRAPSGPELQAWSEVIDTRSRAEVVIGFSESREFQNGTLDEANAFTRGHTPYPWADDVYRIYQATLDREPDAAGFLDWTERLGSGTQIESAASGFVLSREFQKTYGSVDNGDFVELLYQNVLGRGSDPAGKQSWLDALDDGTSRASVVLGFSNSREFVQKTAAPLESWVRDLGVDDVLRGGRGNAIMAGGILSDHFVFTADDLGRDTVLDLEAWDVVGFTGFGYADEAAARAEISQVGANAVFDDQGVTVTFLNTQVAAFTDSVIEV